MFWGAIYSVVFSLGLLSLVITSTAATFQIFKFYKRKNDEAEYETKAAAGSPGIEIEEVVRKVVVETQAQMLRAENHSSARIEIPEANMYEDEEAYSRQRKRNREA